MNRFEDKVAIITGGASGIGLATTERLAQEGAAVVMCGINEEKGRKVVAHISERVTFIKTDIRDESQVKKLLEQTIQKYGHLDIVVNSAGVSIPGESDVTTYSVEDYERTMDTNMKGVFLMTKHSIPALLKSKGTIINIASRLGLKPLKNDAFIYSSSKAGVIMFTKAMALSYKDHELRINCICPGGVDTPLLHVLYENQMEYDKDAQNQFHGRVATPVEIANVVAFLASEEASYVNGATWSVDGSTSI